MTEPQAAMLWPIRQGTVYHIAEGATPACFHRGTLTATTIPARLVLPEDRCQRAGCKQHWPPFGER